MSGFEVLGLVGTIDSSINLAKRVASTVLDYQNYDQDSLKLASSFQQLSFVLRCFHGALTRFESDQNQTIDAKLKEELDQFVLQQTPILRKLECELQIKVERIEKSSKGALSRSAWALWRKSEMETIRNELERWANHFHLVYVSTGALASNQPHLITSESQNRYRQMLSLFKDSESSPKMDGFVEFPRKTLVILQEQFGIGLVEFNNSQRFVAEFVELSMSPWNSIEELIIHITTVANGLCQADPLQSRILSSAGYFKDINCSSTEPFQRVGILFHIPDGFRLAENGDGGCFVTLHDMWNSKPPTHSLEQRFRLAREIVTGLLYAHAVGWVHKGLNPATIIILEEDHLAEEAKTYHGYLPQAFLVGISNARAENSHSFRTSDGNWQLNIYRHPLRHQVQQNVKYRRAFDIYSVGVILLELGLWGLPHFRRFVSLPAVFSGLSSSEMATMIKKFVDGSTEENRKLGRGIQCEMGRKYRDVVLYCLEQDSLTAETNSLKNVERIWKQLDDIACAL